jgi:hypothetical protein
MSLYGATKVAAESLIAQINSQCKLHCKLCIGLMLNFTLGVAQPGIAKCQV